MVVAAEVLPYPVTIAAGSLDRLGDVVTNVAPGNRIAAITDERIWDLYATRITRALPSDTSMLFRVPLTEATKTRETWSLLTDELMTHHFGRDTTLVAIGGGVVGDVVGFVAATFMRGIPFVQVPTTLLAMVDASVGGKTGVDTPHGKNLVGAFHRPSAVVIDPALLETLAPEQYRAGFAEIIKHGVIADAEYFRAVAALLERSGTDHSRSSDLVPIIERSIQIKAGVVTRDERESGLRKVLNFGHTVAHAIESATNYRILHGHAVAIGMVLEARIAERQGIARPGTAKEIARVCELAGLPTALPAIDVDALIAFTHADKKARRGRVEYALPKSVGEMAGEESAWGIPVDDAVVREVLRS